MEYICEICSRKITGDSLKFIHHSEQHIIDIVKKKHPEWIETSGLCQKCLDYYKKELKG